MRRTRNALGVLLVLVLAFMLAFTLTAGAAEIILGGNETDGDALMVIINDVGGVTPRKWYGDPINEWQNTYYVDSINPAWPAAPNDGNGLSMWDGDTRIMQGGWFNSWNNIIDDTRTITLGSKVVGADGSESVTRVWTGDSGPAAGIVITEVFRLDKGMNYYTRNITITNNSGSDLTNVRLYIGGDVFFQGSDYTYGDINFADGSVFCYRNITDGIMTLRGTGRSVPTFYHAKHYFSDELYRSLVIEGWNLRNETTTSDTIDSGYYLQWGDADGGANAIIIPNGGSHIIETVESFSDPGSVQVSSPGNKTVPPGTMASYNFTLTNLLGSPLPGEDIQIALSATSQHGWPTSVNPTSVTMSGTQSINVTVNVWVPADAVDGMSDQLWLTADYSGTYQGQPVSGTATGAAVTIVDTSIPCICDVQIAYLDSTTLDTRIIYMNLAGANPTTVYIYDEFGMYTGISASATIPSGGIISGIDISSLTPGQKYYIHAYVEGIPQPHTTTFFIMGDSHIGLQSLALDPEAATILVGATQQLTPIFTPSDTTQTSLTWTSSDESVATVDASGLVTAVSPGQAIITARSVDNLSIYATSTITVVLPVTNVGGAATVTYAGATFDVSTIPGLFTIDPNAGAPTYTILAGGTGEGTLSGSILTVTKAGTFNIGLTTAASGDYAAGQSVTGVLTVLKGAGAPVSIPVVTNLTSTSFTASSTLLTATGQNIVYAIGTDPATPGPWQSSPNFSGLKPNTQYYVFARSAENDLWFAGEWSVSAPFKTLAKGDGGGGDSGAIDTGDGATIIAWLWELGAGLVMVASSLKLRKYQFKR